MRCRGFSMRERRRGLWLTSPVDAKAVARGGLGMTEAESVGKRYRKKYIKTGKRVHSVRPAIVEFMDFLVTKVLRKAG